MLKYLTVIYCSVLICTGCVEDKKQVKESVATPESPSADLSQNNQKAQNAKPKIECQPVAKQGATFPTFVKIADAGIFVTRFMNSCEMPDGRPGYQAKSPWMAMGFPCTAGRGEIDWKGIFSYPKMVSLSVSTDCPMHPSSLTEIRRVANTSFGIQEDSKLLAFNPLAVQYWEVENVPGAGLGHTVELRATSDLRRFWSKFVDEQEPLRVKLYGRENAWLSQDQWYRVVGEFLFERPRNFRLKVLQAEAMNEQAVIDLKQRCEQLRPRRNCARLF